MRGWRRFSLLWALVAAGVLSSSAAGWHRHRVEAAYRTVEVVLDGEDWRLLAHREGRRGLEFWKALRQAGATSVSVYEATLRRLQEEGRLSYRSGAELRDLSRTGVLDPALRALAARAELGAVYVVPGDPEVAEQVHSGFRAALGAERVAVVLRGPLVLEVRGRLRDLEETGLGFLPSAVARWEQLGFRVVLRPRNGRSLDLDRLREKVRSYGTLLRGRTVVFDLNEVLGYERLVQEAGRALREAGAVYGRVEVLVPARRMRGEEAMTESMRPQVLRVASIAPEELERLPVDSAVDRFLRGVRERNLRMVYVRPYLQTTAGVDAVQFNLAYVERIAEGLRAAGFALGAAEPLAELPGLQLLWWGAVVAATASGVLLATAVGEAAGASLPPRAALALLASGILVAGAGRAAGQAAWVSKLWALLAAVAFPSLALLHAASRFREGPGGLGRGVAVLWWTSGGSALGGLVVGALLSDWPFRLAADGFFGVKLATVAPAVLVAGAWVGWQEGGRPQALLGRLAAWLRQPVTLGAVLVALAAAAAALLLLLRTGNTGLPLPAAEARLREGLERALVARPRTKESLLGHPALLLAAAGLPSLRRWTLPLLVLAAVGQAGLVNSFSHLHTPLAYTAWRTLNGLLVGTGVGALLYGAVTWAVLRRAAAAVRAYPHRVRWTAQPGPPSRGPLP